MVEGIKTVLGFTEANDLSVLTTGQNIDGSRASGADYMFAGAGVFLPVSGAAAKKGFKEFFNSVSNVVSKSDAQQVGRVFDFSIKDGAVVFKNSDNGAGLYDFIITLLVVASATICH